MTKKDIPLSSRIEDFMYAQKALEIKYERKIEQHKHYEKCCLVLATALTRTRVELALSWRALAENINGLGSGGHAYRVANRQRGVSLLTYDLITSGINKLRIAGDLNPLYFPPFHPPIHKGID